MGRYTMGATVRDVIILLHYVPIPDKVKSAKTIQTRSAPLPCGARISFETWARVRYALRFEERTAGIRTRGRVVDFWS